MKLNPVHMFLFQVFMLLISAEGVSQKFMKVNDDLKAVAEPQIITRKGVKVIPYYNFGSFKVIESKAGASKTKTVGNWNVEVSTQYQKMRFTLVNNSIGDTVEVNMEKQGRFAETQVFFRTVTFTNGDVNVVSDVKSKTKSDDWKLVSSWSSGSNLTSGIIAGDKEFKVVTVTEMEGKSTRFIAALSLWLGFEVYDGDKAIAAIQTMPVKGTKYACWIHPDMSPEDQTKMASSLIALLVTTTNELLTE